MITKTKIYIVAAISVIFAFGLIGGSAWSSYKIAKLEETVANAKAAALENQKAAEAKEIEAAEYKQKIEYLESKLTGIKQLARKQDEQLEKLSINSGSARNDVQRARRTSTISATHAELCEKLAELGHPCG